MIRKSFVLLCFLAAWVVPAHATAPIIRGGKPLKGRYIVTFKDDVFPHQVDVLAKALSHQHGGRLLATMTAAMRGFGAEFPEHAVEGLRHNPFIKLIEEDQLVELSAAGTIATEREQRRFDFRTATAPKPASPTTTLVANSVPSACMWQGAGYYACVYTDTDTYWNLDRIDNTGLLYSTKAYAFASTGSTVRAYVVDTGVYAAHQEFNDGRVVAGANMMVDPEIGDPEEDDPDEEDAVTLDFAPETNPCFGWVSSADAGAGHGTAVASVLGGNKTGVAKNVTIVPVKVMNCGGEGSKLAMARGLDWIWKDMRCPNKPASEVTDPDTYPGCIARSGRAVVNISLVHDADPNAICENGSGGYTLCVPAIEAEVNTLIDRNIPVVVAAGNFDSNNCQVSPSRLGYGNEPVYINGVLQYGHPSTYRSITVGATAYDPATSADKRWSCNETPAQCSGFGTWGSGDPGSNHGRCVSIWAPGWNVRVAGASAANSYRSAGKSSTGTSFAAPLVAGAIARLLQTYPGITAYPSAFDVWTRLAALSNSRTNKVDLDSWDQVYNDKLLYMSPFD